jgi:hypothetical protein
MRNPAGLAIGFVAMTIAGRFVGRLVARGAKEPERPPLLPDSVWNEHTRIADGGDWLGSLERTLFFAAFWTGTESLVAGWLAFKLASKWEVWKNIIRVPPEAPYEKGQEWFAATHTFGSWILQRFWIGTLLNVLLAFVAVAVGQAVARLPWW